VVGGAASPIGEVIDVIRPSLHHLSPLGEVLRSVIGLP
jgi:hypothetical protein